jgi:hypothetical protein
MSGYPPTRRPEWEPNTQAGYTKNQDDRQKNDLGGSPRGVTLSERHILPTMRGAMAGDRRLLMAAIAG